jgi:hypothetical protein
VARRDFVNSQPIPVGLDNDMAKYLTTLTENTQLLMKQRGDPINAAILKGDISTDYPANVAATNPSITGLTALQAVGVLANTMATMISDINNLHTTLQALMINMKQ